MTTTIASVVLSLSFRPKTIRLARPVTITGQPNGTGRVVAIDHAGHIRRGDRIGTTRATGLGRAGWLHRHWTRDMFARTIPYSPISDIWQRCL